MLSAGATFVPRLRVACGFNVSNHGSFGACKCMHIYVYIPMFSNMVKPEIKIKVTDLMIHS